MIELAPAAADDESSVRFARVKCPNNLPRLLFVPDTIESDTGLTFKYGEDTDKILLVEDLIGERLETLFPGYRVKNYGLFRVTRNTRRPEYGACGAGTSAPVYPRTKSP